MTLYEQVDAACRKGLYPIIESGEGFFIVSPTKDFFGGWRTSGTLSHMAVAKNNIGTSTGRGKDGYANLEVDGAKIIGYHHIEVEPYKEGDRVQVLEVARNCVNYDEWSESQKEMIGQDYIVSSKNDFSIDVCYTLENNEGNLFCFRHEHLAPYIETNTISKKHQEMLNELRKAGVIKSGEVIV